jgi:hypothetical protein
MQQTLPLQRLLHFQDNLLILSKFQVHWESESLGSVTHIYSYKHIAWLSVYGRTQSLSFDAHCLLLLYAETMSDSTPLKNSLLRQWPTSSLSAGEEKLVATVYKMAIAHCSHWLIAPKWLLLLIITKLVGWASKPGDYQKIELTVTNIKC